MPETVENRDYGNEAAHQRNLSVTSTGSSHFSSPFFSSTAGMPPAQPPTPATSMTYGFDSGSICDESSRSTSAYSNIAYSSLPIPSDQPSMAAGVHTPSGQVKTMLSNTAVSNANRTLFPNITAPSFEDSDMPPPPLPRHVLDAKVNVASDRRAFTWPEPHIALKQEEVGSTLRDRRIESHSNKSDVSMHAGCTSYPDCTSEDADGHIVHSPSDVVKGRKEGSDNGGSKELIGAISQAVH